jgi:hypothetical protein
MAMSVGFEPTGRHLYYFTIKKDGLLPGLKWRRVENTILTLDSAD